MKSCLLLRALTVASLIFLTPALQAQTSAAAPTPPLSSPVTHDFDFWLGEWEVFSFGADKLIGTSRVEAVSGGRALLENWTAGGGQGTGKSLSCFDPHLGQWQQFWVGSDGDISLFKGGLADGKMILTAEMPTRQGARQLMRGTWTPTAPCASNSRAPGMMARHGSPSSTGITSAS